MTKGTAFFMVGVLVARVWLGFWLREFCWGFGCESLVGVLVARVLLGFWLREFCWGLVARIWL